MISQTNGFASTLTDIGSGNSMLQGMTQGILANGAPGTQVVSRLHFENLDSWELEATPGLSVGLAEAATELREQIAALEIQMRRQSQEASEELEAARRAVRVSARQEWESELAERLEVERELVLQTCARFGVERDKYFAGVEAEVVKLSLAIAERVLHREATIDPMMLRSTVRIALERVHMESGVVLRVPPSDAAMWKLMVDSDGKGVAVVADDRLTAGECELETSVGRVELGVRAQLEEIERGFVDLLQRRPA